MNDPRPEAHDHGAAALTDALALCFRILRIALALTVAAYLLSGLTIVRPQERALALTFGRLPADGAARVWTPGFHWAPPRPFAEILRIDAERIRTVEVGAPRPPSGPGGAPAEADSWRQYTLSADANLVRGRWALRYTVADPEAFLLRFGDAPRTLSNEFQRAVLAVAAQTPVDPLLRGDVEGVRSAIEDALRARIGALGLGVRVERVETLALDPPAPVAAAFDDVVQASQERGTRISEAREYAARRLNEAAGEASKIRSEAATYRARLVADTQADAAYFEQILPKYRARPLILLATLRQDGVIRALERVPNKFMLHRDHDGRQELRLWLGPPKDTAKTGAHADGR